MKSIILQQLSELIEAEDIHIKAVLKSKLVLAINMINLDLDAADEERIKKLVITTIKKYADTSDPALKLALIEHYKTLEKLIVNYC